MDKFKIGQIVKVVNHPTCGIRVPFKVDNIQFYKKEKIKMVGEVIFPLCNLATIYIKDNNVIKYRYYSDEILTPDNVLGRVSYNNRLNLTTGDIGKYNVEDYGISLKEIHNRIQELINNKDRVVIEKDGRIYLYIKNEDIPQFKNALKRPELQYLNLEEKIICQLPPPFIETEACKSLS